jgi:hypothetical protein
MPAGQFMGQPLPIATAAIIADHTAGHVAEIDIETGIPFSLTHDFVTGQISHFGDGATETGRADLSTVGA